VGRWDVDDFPAPIGAFRRVWFRCIIWHRFALSITPLLRNGTVARTIRRGDDISDLAADRRPDHVRRCAASFSKRGFDIDVGLAVGLPNAIFGG